VPAHSPSDIAHDASRATYRGRLAPSPTGYLHLGHARTFWTAQARARAKGGILILRNENLDRARCKPEFVSAMFEDFRWFGFEWQEGPDCGGSFAPYNQSERMEFYRAAFAKLKADGFLYPCTCSRKDIQSASRAPHAEDDDEPIYPGTCRQRDHRLTIEAGSLGDRPRERGSSNPKDAIKFNWRFRVPHGETIEFSDGNFGLQQFVAGKDFGDFVVWRQDDIPAYQLAVVVDDVAMRISEVVRGADLLKSTARQLLLCRALELEPPKYFHCPLMTDDTGARLAKRHEALSLRTLRSQYAKPELLRGEWDAGILTP